jgi:hypothetical protein
MRREGHGRHRESREWTRRARCRQQRGGAGRERDLDAFSSGVTDELKDIGALERVAAGKDEDGDVHVRNLIDKRFAFRVRQFIGVGNGLCGSAAVLAGQVTGLRDFPDGQKRGFVKVEPATSGNIVHRLHKTSCGIGTCRTGFRLDSKSTGPGAERLQNLEENRTLAPRFRTRRTGKAGV